MTSGIKRMLFASIGVAVLVGIAAVVDMVAGFPFHGMMMMDIMFLVSAALIGYMGFETYRELAK